MQIAGHLPKKSNMVTFDLSKLKEKRISKKLKARVKSHDNAWRLFQTIIIEINYKC